MNLGNGAFLRRVALCGVLLFLGVWVSGAQGATAVDDQYVVSSQDANQSLLVIANDQLDYSTESAAQQIRIVSVTTNSDFIGTVSISADQHSVIYSGPGYPLDVAVSQSFQYTVADIRGQSTATVSLQVQSSKPRFQANDDQYQTYGEAIPIDPLGNDQYPSGQSVSVSIASPSVGTLTHVTDVDSRPVYLYRPPADLTQVTDLALKYTLTIPNVGSSSATVNIHIDPNGNPLVAGLQNGEERDLATALQIACDITSAGAGPDGGATSPAASRFLQTCGAMQQMSPDNRKATIDQILLRQVGAQGGTVLQLSASQLANIRGRLTQLRSGLEGISLSGLSAQVNGRSLPLGQLLAASEATGGGAGAEILNTGRLGAFINGTLSLGSQGNTGNFGSYDFRNQNLTLGMDYRITDKVVLGVATGYATAHSSADQANTHLDSDTWNISLYGNYYPTSVWYIDWVTGYGHSTMDSSRQITLAGLTSESTGSTGGSQWNVALDTGLDMQLGAYQVGGKVGAEYRAATVNGYTEHNDAGLDLLVGRQRSEAVTGTVGAHVSRAYGLSRGVLIPKVELTWNKLLKRDTHDVTARLAIVPQAGSFSVKTPALDDSYFDLGLSLTAVFPHGWSGFMRYGAELGRSNYRLDTYELGGRMEFDGQWPAFPEFGGGPDQHPAAGLFVSTLGPGLALTFPLYGRSFNLRALVSQAPYSTQRSMGGVNYDLDLHQEDYAGLLDWYPFAGKFHITGGVFAHRTWADGTAQPNQPITIGGQTYTPAQVGVLRARVEYPHSTAPYLGVGWGNAAAPNRRWSFNADLGLMLTEQPRVHLVADSPAAQVNPALQAALDSSLRDEEQNIDNNNLNHFRFWPVLSVGGSYQF